VTVSGRSGATTVRKEDEYFNDIPDEKIPKDMLELAWHIVETKSGHYRRAGVTGHGHE